MSKYGGLVVVVGDGKERPVWVFDWRKGVPSAREVSLLFFFITLTPRVE